MAFYLSNFFVLLTHLLIISTAIAAEDVILAKKVQEFESAESESHIESLSSEVFFIGNGHLLAGDSGKALIYFKTALQMTPKHAPTINKKIIECIKVYKQATLKIPKENCQDVNERASFLKQLSPDSYHEIVGSFPNCLNIADIKSDLEVKAVNLLDETKRVMEDKSKVEVELKKIDEFNKTKFSFLDLKLPTAKIELEKQTYESLGDEISTILSNRDFLPDDIISTMQNEALKLIKIENSKVELDYARITDKKSGIKIPIKLSILNNQIIRDEFVSRYRQLLEVKGSDVNLQVAGTNLKVTPKVFEYLSRNRFFDLKNRNSNKDARSFLPIYPAYLSLRFELFFKDPANTIVALLPFGLGVFNDSFTPVLIKDNFKHAELAKRHFNGNFESYENQLYILEQTLGNEYLKQLVDVKISLDMDSTIILNNILRENPILSSGEIQNYSFREENGDVMTGMIVKEKKEGLFYVMRNGKQTGSIIYVNDLPLSAGSDKKNEVGVKYCMDLVCHHYALLEKKQNAYSIKFSFASAQCAMPDIEGVLKTTDSKMWTGIGEEGEKISLRFEKDNQESETIMLKLDGVCMALMGDHVLIKKVDTKKN